MKMLHHTVVFFTLLLKVVDIRAECEKPSVGDNRVLTLESVKDTYPDGSTAKFTCSIGYKTLNTAAAKIIECINGQWTELQLQCKKKSCGSLHDLRNGRYLLEEGITFGATAIAECNEGYLLVGPKARFCRDSGWSDRPPVCEVVRCSKPPTIENGGFEEEPYESYEYGQAVSYECKSGFVIVGRATISCSINGTFQPPPPKCLKDSCEKPVIPHGIRIAGLGPPYKFLSYLQYKCDEGYKIEGSDKIVCKEGDWVPPPPQCIEITCDAPDVEHAVRIPDSSLYKYKQSVQYECNSGYRMEGNGVLTCEEKGWNFAPPRCSEVTCGAPVVPNGQIAEEKAPLYRYNSSVQFSCDKGYTSDGVNYLVCKENGWNPPPSQCRGITCEAPDVEHAVRIPDLPRYRYNQSVQYECNSGYRVEGNGVLTCEEKVWNFAPPRCSEITCEASDVEHAVRIPDSSLYKYKQSVQYKCNSGYRVEGKGILTCEEKGWNLSPPRCSEVICGAPVVPNGQIAEEKAPSYRYDSSIQFSCDKGYTSDGVNYLVCKENGWNPPPSQCREITCEAPDVKHSVRIPDSSLYNYKQSVQYKCNSFYRVEGNGVLTCEEKGWNFAPPRCSGHYGILITVILLILILFIIFAVLVYLKKKKEKTNSYSLGVQYSKEESHNVDLKQM